MRGEWEVVGFGHADGDDDHVKRVVLGAFDTDEEAFEAYHKHLDALVSTYEAEGGDVEMFEFSVQHKGVDKVLLH